MTSHYFFCFLLVLPLQIQAEKEGDPAGASQAGTGGVSVFASGIWASFNNPAGLYNINQPMAALFVENRFLIKELYFNAASFAIPVSKGGLAIAVSDVGANQYNNIFAGFAYGRSFGENFSAGLRFDYYQESFGSEYGKGSAVSFEAGMQWQINEKTGLALSIFNPLKAQYKCIPPEEIPSLYRAGVFYKPVPELQLLFQAEKSSRDGNTFHYGLEYAFNEQIYLRAGYSTNPSGISFGCGYTFSVFTIDIAAKWHQTLGFSPQGSLIYRF
jgi:long-subunit fatty acid transport protein